MFICNFFERNKKDFCSHSEMALARKSDVVAAEKCDKQITGMG